MKFEAVIYSPSVCEINGDERNCITSIYTHMVCIFLVRGFSDSVHRTLIFGFVYVSLSPSVRLPLLSQKNSAIEFSDFCLKLSLRECKNMTFSLFTKKFFQLFLIILTKFCPFFRLLLFLIKLSCWNHNLYGFQLVRSIVVS